MYIRKELITYALDSIRTSTSFCFVYLWPSMRLMPLVAQRVLSEGRDLLCTFSQ